MKSIPLEALPQVGQDKLLESGESEEFRTSEVLTIAGGHLVNDTYTAFLPALLPVIIDKLSLSLTMAGSLTAIQQIPGVLNPFIGYLADRMSLRYFVILAPAATATLVSIIGIGAKLPLPGIYPAAHRREHCRISCPGSRHDRADLRKASWQRDELFYGLRRTSSHHRSIGGSLGSIFMDAGWDLPSGLGGLDDLADPLLAAKSSPGVNG